MKTGICLKYFAHDCSTFIYYKSFFTFKISQCPVIAKKLLTLHLSAVPMILKHSLKTLN